MKKLFAVLCLLALAIVICCGHAFAQATASASLTGTVIDQSQAVVANAQITLTNKDTGAVRTVQSNSDGLYRFDLLPAGNYELKVTLAGFKTITVASTELIVGETSTLNFTLEPGSVSQTVTVTEQAPIVDVTKTNVGLDITQQQIQNMPLNGRDFGNLAYLAPGARPVNSYDPTKNRVSVVAINGSTGRNVNVTVNGIDDKDNTVGGPVMQLPLSAVEEFDISTQRFSAANGRSEGAAINVITKAGSNKFHGGGYFYDTQTALNHNDYFTEQTPGSSTPQFERQQFGGDIGGPIRKDKDFFFFALERQREHTADPITAKALTSLTLAEPIGAQPAAVIPTPYFDWRYTGRLDHRFNDRESMFFTYNAQNNSGLNDQSGNNNDLTAGNFTTNHLILSNLTLSSVLSPTIVNDATAGYQYWNNVIGTNKFSPFTVIFPDGSNFGTNGNVPQQSIQKKWQFKDDLSITHGVQTFHTGVDFVWEPVLGGLFEFDPVPTLTFLANPAQILGDTSTYPNGFATAGLIGNMIGASGDPDFFLASKMFGVYFQDDWKIRSGLTLNLGVRWDKDIGLYASSQIPNNRTYQELKAVGSPYASSIPQDDNRGISPRIGFAWDVTGTGKHILRGGYGLYFGQTFINIPLFMMQQANPTIFATTYNINSAGPGDPNCTQANGCVVPGTNILLSNWRFGVDPLPVSPPPPTELLPKSTGRLMDPSYRNPYSEQWNIGYTYEINSISSFEVDYIHELGLHEANSLNINAIDPSTGIRVYSNAFAAANVPVLGNITDSQSNGRSRYDGLNFVYTRRMSQHFTANASYVLSRAVGWDGSAASFGNSPVNPFNPWNPAVDFGPVPNDERHHIAVSGIVSLPWGFDVAPILQFGSARPFSASAGLDILGIGANTPRAVVQVSDPKNYTYWTVFQNNANKANPGSVSNAKLVQDQQACLAASQCMFVPFDSLRGQDFFELDTRVTKEFNFNEKGQLRLIFQAFDVTNRANFGNTFGGSVRSLSTFDQPTGYLAPSGTTIPKSFRGEFGVEYTF